MKAALAALLIALPVAAQDFGLGGTETDPLPDFSNDEFIGGGIVVETLEIGRGEAIDIGPRATPVVRASAAAGAILRGLDKVTGEVEDLELAPGETAELGRLDVTLGECRAPDDNPTGDAYALVTVTSEGRGAPAFQGWMIASSPALSALDHPRYDVWVIRCTRS